MNHRPLNNRAYHPTSFRMFAGAIVAIALLTGLMAVSPACGQTQIVSNNRSTGNASGSKGDFRSREFDNLARQATGVEKHYSLIKNVIKAVSPSVVHIEAKKRQKSSGNRGGASFIEEAGSGIVLGYGGANYVVTNFHVVENSQVSDIRLELSLIHI